MEWFPKWLCHKVILDLILKLRFLNISATIMIAFSDKCLFCSGGRLLMLYLNDTMSPLKDEITYSLSYKRRVEYK